MYGRAALTKRKLTLSISKELIEEAKTYAREAGRSLSDIVEEHLECLAYTRWVDILAEELGVGSLEPSSENEIPMSRPRGLNAAEVVRELRRGRAKAISHGTE